MLKNSTCIQFKVYLTSHYLEPQIVEENCGERDGGKVTWNLLSYGFPIRILAEGLGSRSTTNIDACLCKQVNMKDAQKSTRIINIFHEWGATGPMPNFHDSPMPFPLLVFYIQHATTERRNRQLQMWFLVVTFNRLVFCSQILARVHIFNPNLRAQVHLVNDKWIIDRHLIELNPISRV